MPYCEFPATESGHYDVAGVEIFLLFEYSKEQLSITLLQKYTVSKVCYVNKGVTRT